MGWDTSKFASRLSEDDERRCFELMHQGNAEARNKLIECNTRLVLFVLSKMKYNKDTDMDDLISCGMIGLIKAVDEFSIDSGNKFNTFAITCIRRKMLSYFRDKYKHVEVLSLDSLMTNNGSQDSFADTMVDDFNVEEIIDTREDCERMMKAVGTVLTERQKQAIGLRYGFDCGYQRTQAETGKIMGITKEGAKRLEGAAIEKIREAMESGVV